MPAGVITLGQVAPHRLVLDVVCNRCDRRGRLRIDRLLDEHGPDMPMPELRMILAADCPRIQANEMRDPCGVHFPALSTLKL